MISPIRLPDVQTTKHEHRQYPLKNRVTDREDEDIKLGEQLSKQQTRSRLSGYHNIHRKLITTTCKRDAV